MLSTSLLSVDHQVLNADMLATLVERNAGNILDEISVEKAQAYLDLKTRLHQVDVRKDEDFQRDFIKWANIRGRKFNKENKTTLFNFLENTKEQEKFPFREAYRAIFAKTGKKFNKTHFRILTSLASLVDPQYPIFDDKIVSLYRFKAKRGVGQTKHDKFSMFLRFYRYVRETFEEISTNKMLHAPLIALKVKLQRETLRLPAEKRLDLLIYSAANLASDKALVRAAV